MSASFALQVAILAALRSDAGVKAALGDPVRIYDVPPMDIGFPFAVLERADCRPWGGMPVEGDEHTLSIHIWSRYGGAREAKQITAAIRSVLQDAVLSVEGHRLVNLRVTYADHFRGADARTQHGIVRLRAVTEPV
jgi:hypothetical protein